MVRRGQVPRFSAAWRRSRIILEEFNALDVPTSEGSPTPVATHPIVDKVAACRTQELREPVGGPSRVSRSRREDRAGPQDRVPPRAAEAIFLFPLAEIDSEHAGPLSILHGFPRPSGPKEGLSLEQTSRRETTWPFPSPDAAESCRLAWLSSRSHRPRSRWTRFRGHDLWIHPPMTRKKGEVWLFFQVGSDQMYPPVASGSRTKRPGRRPRRSGWQALGVIGWKHHAPERNRELRTLDDLEFGEESVVVRETRRACWGRTGRDPPWSRSGESRFWLSPLNRMARARRGAPAPARGEARFAAKKAAPGRNGILSDGGRSKSRRSRPGPKWLNRVSFLERDRRTPAG